MLTGRGWGTEQDLGETMNYVVEEAGNERYVETVLDTKRAFCG